MIALVRHAAHSFAGTLALFLTFVMTYELIQIVIDRNNLLENAKEDIF